MEIGPGQYYYSPRHIARDFVSTIAPFALFSGMTVFGIPRLRSLVVSGVERLEPELSWTIVAVVVAAYVCVAYVAGALANRIFLIPRYLSQAFSDRFEYAQYYPVNAAAITAWHQRFVPQWGFMRVEVESELQQKIDQLVWFFQLSNPAVFYTSIASMRFFSCTAKHSSTVVPLRY